MAKFTRDSGQNKRMNAHRNRSVGSLRSAPSTPGRVILTVLAWASKQMTKLGFMTIASRPIFPIRPCAGGSLPGCYLNPIFPIRPCSLSI